jgi:hypothetical protein
MMGESNMGMGNGGGTGGMNFNNPMSFANNIFNASSLYGSVGISMVNGVKVTSISVLENNEISVTLRHSAATQALRLQLPVITKMLALQCRHRHHYLNALQLLQ